MMDRVREIAYVVVLFRRQWEVEKTRLVTLAAFGGGTGAASFNAALNHKWGVAVVSFTLAVIAGALFEWRWEVAMRIPGSTSDEWRPVRAAGSPAPDDP